MTEVGGGAGRLDRLYVLAALRQSYFAAESSADSLAATLERLWRPVQELGIVASVPLDWRPATSSNLHCP